MTANVYDANGNTRTNLEKISFLAPQNRGIKAVVGGINITLVYDGAGQRVRKIVGPTTNTYLMDRLNPTGYAPGLAERITNVLVQANLYKFYRDKTQVPP